MHDNPTDSENNQPAVSARHLRIVRLLRRIREVWNSPYVSPDSARLDWLQANKKTVWKVSHEERRPTTMTDGRTEQVQIFDGWTVDNEDNPRQSIRDAIDEAVLQSNKE
jgi:hypothetical protein